MRTPDRTDWNRRQASCSLWVTNVVDPDYEYACSCDKRPEMLSYIAKFTKGRPQASTTYTTKQLESFGLIGLYRKEK